MLILRLLAAAVLVAVAQPTVHRLTGAWSWNADSTVISYRARVHLSGPLRSRDWIRYTVYRGGTLVDSALSKRTDTALTWAAPPPGVTQKLRAFARVFVDGTTPSGKPKGDSVTVTGPEGPAPVVDSIRLSPDSATMSSTTDSLDVTGVVFSR